MTISSRNTDLGAEIGLMRLGAHRMTQVILWPHNCSSYQLNKSGGLLGGRPTFGHLSAGSCDAGNFLYLGNSMYFNVNY